MHRCFSGEDIFSLFLLCQWSHPEFPQRCCCLTLNPASLARARKFLLYSIQRRLASVPLMSHPRIEDCFKNLITWISGIRFWTFIVPEASHCQCPVLVLDLGLQLLLHSSQSHGIPLGHCPKLAITWLGTSAEVWSLSFCVGFLCPGSSYPWYWYPTGFYTEWCGKLLMVEK